MDFYDMPQLENAHVRLEPLSHAHHHGLEAALAVGGLRSAWYTQIPAPGQMTEVISERLALREAGKVLPWAVVDAVSGQAVGMTSYLNLDPVHRRVEIGSTWLGKSAQGTSINPAAKLLLLSHAFDDLACIAVEFRTHWHNRQSRAAIEKLGAKQDGVLRNHMILSNGTVRDTVVYSVIDGEWSTVRVGLEERLRR